MNRKFLKQHLFESDFYFLFFGTVIKYL